MQEVEKADRYQICKWHRFLPSPGERHIGKENYSLVVEREVEINKRLWERFVELGGFTPEISKSIGWVKF